MKRKCKSLSPAVPSSSRSGSVSHSVVSDSAIRQTVACQASLSMEFSRQEHRSGLPFPSPPGDLPNPGIESRSPALQSTPVFVPGESHGQRRPVGHSPWGCKELNTTERLTLLSD